MKWQKKKQKMRMPELEMSRIFWMILMQQEVNRLSRKGYQLKLMRLRRISTLSSCLNWKLNEIFSRLKKRKRLKRNLNLGLRVADERKAKVADEIKVGAEEVGLM